MNVKTPVPHYLLMLCLNLLRFLREILLEDYYWFSLKFQHIADVRSFSQPHIWVGWDLHSTERGVTLTLSSPEQGQFFVETERTNLHSPS